MNIQEAVRKQIVQELKINQTSQCRHVVVCYHAFYHNGIIYLVLEYMDRGSLADIIKQLKTILEPYLAIVCKQARISCISTIYMLLCCWELIICSTLMCFLLTFRF